MKRDIFVFEPNHPNSYRKMSEPIAPDEFNSDELRKLLADMADTMYAANGIGLAAPQILTFKRVAMVHVGHDEANRLIMVNPEILERDGVEAGAEGCLSVPGCADKKVPRAKEILFRFFTPEGDERRITASGLIARAVQHEVDHLNGKFFFDHISSLRRNMIFGKLNKQIRRHLEYEKRALAMAASER